MQGQGASMLYLEQKIHVKNFHALLKKLWKPWKFSPVKLFCLRYTAQGEESRDKYST